METKPQVSRFSHLLEARHELRQHLVLETTLIERISELPEEDFCQNIREALALGAGYASVLRDQEADDDQWLHVFSTFFALQPRNRYLDPEHVRQQQGVIIKAALDGLDNGRFPEIDPAINHYTIMELAAFIEGFTMTRDYFATDVEVGEEVA